MIKSNKAKKSNNPEFLDLVDPVIEVSSSNYLENWIKTLKAKDTKRQYPVRLKYFLSSVYMKEPKTKEEIENFKFKVLDKDLSILIEKFMLEKDRPDFIEACFQKFFRIQYLRIEKKEVSKGTIVNYHKAAKNFCDFVGISTTWKRITKLMPKTKNYANDRPPNEDEISKIVSSNDMRLKIITLLMLTSGMRIECFNYLKLKDIEPKYDKNSKLIAAKITLYADDPEQYDSFITPECYKAITDYVEFRRSHGEETNPNSPVVRNRFKTTEKHSGNIGTVNDVKILSLKGVKSLLERRAQTMKLFPPLVNGEKRREWKIAHGMRKYFKTKCELYMKSIYVEKLMGHELGITESYLKLKENELLSEYLKAVDGLTFTKDLSEMEEELETIKGSYMRLEKKLLLNTFNSVMSRLRDETYEKYLKLDEKTKEEIRRKNEPISKIEQYRYFEKSYEGKEMKKEDLEYIKKMCTDYDKEKMTDEELIESTPFKNMYIDYDEADMTDEERDYNDRLTDR